MRRRADAAGAEDLIAAIDERDVLRRRAEPELLRPRRAILRQLADACHAAGALLVVVVTEVVSLGLIKPPGEMGADIVVGEGQSIGNALNFGGPYVGLFATREKFVRQMPGRLVRRDRRRRRPARLRADAVDARAAYPPREGDLATSAPIPASARSPSPST